jgi:hypothetical protein
MHYSPAPVRIVVPVIIVALITLVLPIQDAAGQAGQKQRAKQKQKAKAAAVTFPPHLPGGEQAVTDSSPEFLKPPATLREGVAIAQTPPTVDFQYFPGQTYETKLWSNWGDSIAVGGKYYASIGDHAGPSGNAFVFEYDPATKAFRRLVDLKKLLNLPEGHYVPGKIHSRLDLGSDGWLYFSTHRGSTNVTTDRYHYQGDWIIRCRPGTENAEVVARGPVPKHCIPCGVLDPDRLIFYGGTAPGEREDGDGIHFFAYDVRQKKVLCDVPNGPARYMIFARSTGRIYYVPGKEDSVAAMVRYDPAVGGNPVKTKAVLGLRAATQETPQGIVYTVSQGRRGSESTIYAFDTKTESVNELGPAAVGSQSYITSLDADPTGRYLYYIPGAHGGSENDGSAVVQFDTRTGKKKVIAFLHPFYQTTYGAILRGTFSSAVDPNGETLYITWNVSRTPGNRAWDCCALTAIHIPESERQ